MANVSKTTRFKTVVIEVKNLNKVYDLQGTSLAVLKNLSFHVKQATWLSVTGPSGSGKSTLLSLMAGLDSPSSGEITVLGENLSKLSEDARADFRAQNMGFVFQSFRLLPSLSALENVQVPMEILRRGKSEAAAAEMLARVGLKERMHHYPNQLSGGEQQRVALARAFVSRPKILFADEPTGNLDSKNGARVLELLESLHREEGATLIVVTHEPQVAERAREQLYLRDGERVST